MLLNNMDTTDNSNAAFWLPTHFLTDDDLFDPFAPTPSGPLDSPLSSTESSNDINNDDDLLSELTRQLAESTLLESPSTRTNNNFTEKPWSFSTSPQSTLTGFGPWSNRSGFTSNGSPNGPSQVSSPPLTPPGAGVAKNDAAWELLYEAAGQVARLKMSALAAQINQHQHQPNRGLLSAPRHPSLYDLHPTSQFQQVKRQGREEWYCQHHHNHQQPRRSCGGGGGGGALGLSQTAWPPLRTEQPHHLHNHRQQGVGPAGCNMRAVFLGPGSRPSPPVKRQSTGTGVFLPRRVGTTHHQQPEPRKKPTGCSTVLLPARVVQALNLDLEEMNNGGNRNSHSRYGSGFVAEHEILMARRNALLGQQQRRSLRPDGHGPAPTMVGHDIRLPSDWTY